MSQYQSIIVMVGYLSMWEGVSHMFSITSHISWPTVTKKKNIYVYIYMLAKM